MQRSRSRLTPALVVVVLFGCGKKPDDAPGKPADTKPADTKPSEAEPVYKPVCAKMLPKDLVDKAFAGLALKAVAETGDHATCKLKGVDDATVTINYDCSTDVRANGPGAFMAEHDAKGAKKLDGIGAAAYLVNDYTGARYDPWIYRVLGNDAPCRVELSWIPKPPGNALELVKAVVAGCTMAALK